MKTTIQTSKALVRKMTMKSEAAYKTYKVVKFDELRITCISRFIALS